MRVAGNAVIIRVNSLVHFFFFIFITLLVLSCFISVYSDILFDGIAYVLIEITIYDKL